jgi:hypothetical protein
MQHKQNTLTRRLRSASLWAALSATLTLTACASLGSSKPEDQVRQRVNERWQALVAGEFTRAYSYNTPGFRAVVTADAYRSRTGSAVKWLGAEAVEVKCPEASKCTATVRIDYRPMMMGGRAGDKFNTHVDETWLREDGKWWIFQSI